MIKIDKKTVETLKAYLKKNLSKKRYIHSLNVADSAKELAHLYGEDENRAYFTGLVHDIARELSHDKQLGLAKKSMFDVSEIELETPPLLHAIAGAQILSDKFSIDDTEILLAVRYHTVAAGRMSRLAQIVYLADAISIDRDYKDVKKMRRAAHTSLEKGMYKVLKFAVTDPVKNGHRLPLSTVEAYNEFVVKQQSEN